MSPSLRVINGRSLRRDAEVAFTRRERRARLNGALSWVFLLAALTALAWAVIYV